MNEGDVGVGTNYYSSPHDSQVLPMEFRMVI
jgi:hypothetical protein